MTITLYDIPSTVPGRAWSPSVWKTRYCLNYKGLEHKTEWVEWPDLETTFVKLGIPATSKRADGSSRYTVPAIFDSTTGVYLAESFEIAQYLDHAYPDTPRIFPNSTTGMQKGFQMAFGSLIEPIVPFLVPAEGEKLTVVSQEYFRRTREKMYGKSLEDVPPKGQDKVREWAKLKDNMGVVNEWYCMSGNPGPFLLGETASWADFLVGAIFIWGKVIWGDNSHEWKDIELWHDGRWKALLDSLSIYQRVT
ncbi:hypothetical protein CPB83DRAFT_868076 [Crepidotus variabilis]|uniref:GST N-terminal domain-containing protein n=1 Tax=Crepidotus variabilis TaxID=179855 RepID=A0A9P6EMC6_9AGAR|nr:hypothetical protein CPB83DRAFT_868076 [Crepidotus variabilis]